MDHRSLKGEMERKREGGNEKGERRRGSGLIHLSVPGKIKIFNRKKYVNLHFEATLHSKLLSSAIHTI